MDMHKLSLIRISTLLFLTLTFSGCSEFLRQFIDSRGYRYCEILFQYPDRTEVWGTQGLNRCPSEDWLTLDFNSLQESSGAINLIRNGPRYFVINSSRGMSLPEGSPEYFGNLKMRKLASTGRIKSGEAFTEITVLRDNTWIFDARKEIYILENPEGHRYVMQSYSQIIDNELQESDLPNLANKIDLPAGWTFKAKTLEEELLVDAAGAAIVIQDTLMNTYQKF